jgi:hypothetical protein
MPLVEMLLGVIRQLLDHIPHLEKTNPQLRDAMALLKDHKSNSS